MPESFSSSATENEPKRMVRPFVKISLNQYKELDALRREKKEPLSRFIRKALSSLTKKKEHSIGTLPSFLPASTKDKYKTVSAYFPRDEWNSLKMISTSTGRCKTDLLRIAVEEYLKDIKSTRDWIYPEKIEDCNSFNWERHPHWGTCTPSRSMLRLSGGRREANSLNCVIEFVIAGNRRSTFSQYFCVVVAIRHVCLS